MNTLYYSENTAFLLVLMINTIKVGEPNNPVASAERGRRVPVRSDEFFSHGP